MTGKEVIFISAILLLFLSFLNFVSAQEVPVCFGAELRDDRPCETYGDECSDEGQSAMDGPGSGYYYNSTSDEFTQCYDYADRCGDSGRCDGCPSSEQDLNKIIEKLEFVYDEEYVEQTKKERLFDPNSRSAPTPFDKMKVKIKVPKVYERCLGNLKGVLSKGGVEVYSGDFSLSPLKSSDSKYVYYEMIVDANPMTPKAWTEDEELLEKVINDGEIKIIVKKEGWTNDDLNNYAVDKKVGACLRLWGPDGNVKYQYKDVDAGGYLKYSKTPAQFKFVYVRTQSAGWGTKEIEKQGIEVLNAFHSIDPFKSYKHKVAQEVDLKAFVRGDEFTSFWVGDVVGPQEATFLSKMSSCKTATLYNIYSQKGVYKNNAVSLPGSGTTAISTDSVLSLAKTNVHETAHGFCLLEDEYIDSEPVIVKAIKSFKERGQCAPSEPSSSPYFLPYGDQFLGCTEASYLRSSTTSIMGSPYDTRLSAVDNRPFRFNVVGCSYCRAKLLGKSTKFARGTEALKFTSENFDCILERTQGEVCSVDRTCRTNTQFRSCTPAVFCKNNKCVLDETTVFFNTQENSFGKCDADGKFTTLAGTENWQCPGEEDRTGEGCIAIAKWDNSCLKAGACQDNKCVINKLDYECAPGKKCNAEGLCV